MGYFQEKDGLKFRLEQLVTNGNDEFPQEHGGIEVIRDFKNFEDEITKKVHPRVSEGSAVSGDGRLTEHGIPHINRVFRCANKLLSGRINELSGYEIFLLCVAIHLHDIGNIDGREGHEKRIREVLKSRDVKTPINDTIAFRTVIQIARAHGGISDIHQDKDTLFDLQNKIPLFGDFIVRPAMIASILRFADEMSDFYKRTDDYIDIPEENKIHHALSSLLQECVIDGRAIELKYRLKYEDTQKQIKPKIYLYDEIRSRLAKLMREMEYCTKYSEGFIRINEVHVTILVSKKDNENDIHFKDTFKLCLRGYPDDKVNLFDYYLDYDRDTKKPIEPKCKSGAELKTAVKRGG